MFTTCVLALLAVSATLCCGELEELESNVFRLVDFQSDFPAPSHLWQATLLRQPLSRLDGSHLRDIPTMMRLDVTENGTKVEEVLVVFGGETLGIVSDSRKITADTYIYRTYLSQVIELFFARTLSLTPQLSLRSPHRGAR